MTADLSSEIELASLRSVLVLLVPMGNISFEKFKKYAKSISSVNTVAFRDVFNFKGIADCSVEDDLNSLSDFFSSKVEFFCRFSHSLVLSKNIFPHCCLAFELRSDQTDPEIGYFKVIPDQDESHFKFYFVHIIMEEFVRTWISTWNEVNVEPLEVLISFASKKLLEEKNLSRKYLITPLDTNGDGNATTNDNDSKKKRKLLARAKKQIADYFLFLGLYSKSIRIYESAIETFKLLHDWEWIGAALECSACALEAMDKIENDSEIINKLKDSVYYYSIPSCNWLRVRALVKLKNQLYKSQMDPKSLINLTTESHSLVVTNQTEPLALIAFFYKSKRFLRKFLFYIYNIALSCINTNTNSRNNSTFAFHFVLHYLHKYYIKNFLIIGKKSHYNEEKTCLRMNGGRDAARIPWFKIHHALLRVIIGLSRSSDEWYGFYRHFVYFFKYIFLFNNEIFSIMDEIKEIGIELLLNGGEMVLAVGDEGLGLGVVRSFRVLRDESVVWRQCDVEENPLFIYRPKKHHKKDLMSLVGFAWAEHVVYLDLLVENLSGKMMILDNATVEFSMFKLVGDGGRYDVEWMTMDDRSIEDAGDYLGQALTLPSGLTRVRINTVIPNFESVSDDCLLVPESLHYSYNNFRFSELLFDRSSVKLSFMLSNSFKYVFQMPELNFAPCGPCVSNSGETSITTGVTVTVNGDDEKLTPTYANDCKSNYFYRTLYASESTLLHLDLFNCSNQNVDQLVVHLSEHLVSEKRSFDRIISYSVTSTSISCFVVLDSSNNDSNNEDTKKKISKMLSLKNRIPTSRRFAKFLSTHFASDLFPPPNNTLNDALFFCFNKQNTPESPSGPNSSITKKIDHSTCLWDHGSFESQLKKFQKFLPLKPHQTAHIDLPTNPSEPGVGCLQFQLHYRNLQSNKNLWRKKSLRFPLLILKSPSIHNIDLWMHGSMPKEPHEDFLVHLVVDIRNCTQLGFALQLEKGETHQFLVPNSDCWEPFFVQANSSYQKNFCLNASKIFLIAEEKRISKEEAIKSAMKETFRFSWNTLGNRCGTLIIADSTIEGSSLWKVLNSNVFSVSLGMEDAKDVVTDGSECRIREDVTFEHFVDWSGIFVGGGLRMHKVSCYKPIQVNASIKQVIGDTKFERLFFSFKIVIINSSYYNGEFYCWIGKYENVLLERAMFTGDESGNGVVNLSGHVLFYSPGIYKVECSLRGGGREVVFSYLDPIFLTCDF